ncbi:MULTISPECIES: LysR family transcriptional regulator [Rubrivivax]|uniref:LysR family transcriptional regulator n=1 Tax=Rubrivivax benzoatilyticus TaxID=316997 RepID=A0ABX0HXF6_9BURK|nr:MULTISPECIES: LysR family transcriptional regulator [Rubrivivax]MCD0417554.1 LysR substrate-binding domain-containing protein [Rubrivivax sp. JA1024]EGJ12382.1 LysR family transcriptional regulator [Rubrivivax benzoatilyticus JA2 = ATCC BAA-35]MCC9598348.1 LysR substrate-binding domain-containing protein [Rubrivivax sp. JA1055]MCC9645396.1 LysR substrate-binding domain-containing protein [Rubrivivax sp. JA1029]NHK99288.1 LysR family transcriptional regulator [Rubrivivax benzoatilyticus]
MNVTFRQLRVFVEVARQGSVQGAAEVLHLTPPAVSLQIKEIESQVGHKLFERTHRRMSLSTAGEYFLVYARRLLGTLKEAEDAMARFARLESGRLTIGMVSSAKYFLPQLLAKFHTEHPAIDVRLRLGNREALVAMMAANEVDLSVMGRPPVDFPSRAEPFAKHPHVLVTAPDHRFAHAESVPAAALAHEPFIVREPASGTRTALQEYLDQYRLKPTFVMEMPSNEAIKQAVMAGMGVSLLSLHTIGLEWSAGLIAAPHVEGLPLMRRWNIVNTAAKQLSPAAEAFRYFVLDRGEAHLAAMFNRADP